MFRKVLRKKLVLESLYICRRSSKVTPVLLFSSEFCRFFKDTYLVENLRTVTSDHGYFSRSVWGNSKKYVRSGFPSFDLPSTPLFSLVRFRAPPSNRKVRSSWLELTLSPSISILAKFRGKKLIMSTSIFG